MNKSAKWFLLIAGVAMLLLILLALYLLIAPPSGQPGKPAQARGNLIVNGSFETPEVPADGPLYLMAPASELKPWETDLSTAEIWASGLIPPSGAGKARSTPCDSADGRQNLEVISDPEFKGAVWQTVTTVPGKRYALTFFHAPRPGAQSTLTVSANTNVLATLEEDGKGVAGLAWKKFAATFTAESNATTVKFSDEAKLIGQGTHIDGVVLKAE